MAKITIAGDSIVVTLGKTLANIKSLEAHRPKVLHLYDVDDDGNKTKVFSVASGAKGIINCNGAVFASVTHDENKYATITMPIPAGIENAVEYAAEKFGAAVTMLNKVESQFDEAIKEVAAEKDAVRKLITVAN